MLLATLLLPISIS